MTIRICRVCGTEKPANLFGELCKSCKVWKGLAMTHLILDLGKLTGEQRQAASFAISNNQR